ncbi:MAG TPA: hypothetical protein VG432_01300 [Gemmatimonadaceae bacterium]|nr:hypothetical protein [Gemmatimonadaceae bacterium]
MSESGPFDEQTGERESWREPGPAAVRPRLRLPTKLPRPAGARERSRISALISFALHALIIGLLVLPALLSPSVRSALATGAGGAGPAGGGGGSGGVFGTRETLRYVRVAPEPVPAQATPVPVPVPKPVPPKPAEVKPPTPQVEPQATPPPTDAAPATGGAAGAGNTSGSGGAGPGSGGGTGSGIGTGTGSANGPGTGGGADSVYPPQPTQVFIPPTPIPSKIRPFTLVAQFDVDSSGKVLSVDFNETRDGGYNKKLREQLARIRFRPAVKRDGTPIRATAQIEYDM